jgi:hypothetical protein
MKVGTPRQSPQPGMVTLEAAASAWGMSRNAATRRMAKALADGLVVRVHDGQRYWYGPAEAP